MPPTWSGERTRRELIRLTHRQLDTATLFRDSTQVLSHFVAFDAACGHTMDPATLLLTRQFSEQFDADGFALVCRNEYLQPDVNKFASLLDRPSPVATLAETTEGRPDRSHRFREILRPFGFGPELRATFTTGGACWASLVVLRHAERLGSAQSGTFVVNWPYIAHAVRSSLLMASSRHGRRGLGAGLVLLNARGRRGDRPSGAALARRACGYRRRYAGLPIIVVAAAARRAVGRAEAPPANSTLRACASRARLAGMVGPRRRAAAEDFGDHRGRPAGRDRATDRQA
jgi:hypothetical protein